MQQQRDRMRAQREASQERQKVNAASALVIGEHNDTDPVSYRSYRESAFYLSCKLLEESGR